VHQLAEEPQAEEELLVEEVHQAVEVAEMAAVEEAVVEVEVEEMAAEADG
jgi:hypothetical protein